MGSRLLPIGESTGHLVDTLRALVGREFRMRYKGSSFGILWTILSPLGSVVILQYVFTKIIVIAIPHFASFMYSALLPWVWFSVSVQTGSTTLLDNRDLVRTPFFVKSLLPWAVTCTNFLLYLFALPVLLGLMAADGVRLTSAIVALPIIWLVQWILTLGFTVLIAALGVIIRDIQHLMVVLLVFWFYLTPIFYDLKLVPPEAVRWYSANPMAALVTAHRAVTVYGEWPNWVDLAGWGLIGVVILGVSLTVFRELEDAFIEGA